VSDHPSRPTLLLGTNNAGKVRELRDLLSGCGWRLLTPAEAGITLDPEETGTTYEENARLKAHAFSAASGLWSLADDSGLEVDALDGAPGLHSARFAGAETPHTEKVRILLHALAQTPPGQRGARFRASFVLTAPDGRDWSVEGVWEGTISNEPRGAHGFGYDPIFIGAADGRTGAEMTLEEKSRVSHRARAAQALLPLLHRLAGEANATGLSHVDARGQARMVDVSAKDETRRVAVAKGRVLMRAETLALIEGGGIAKGNVLTTAQIAGVMAAKRTHELIPMCHPLLLTGIDVQLTPDAAGPSVEITATVKTTGKTGVEMEALTAVSIAALTIYDMCKAVDRGMRIEAVRVVEKHGGKSGDIVWSDER